MLVVGREESECTVSTILEHADLRFVICLLEFFATLLRTIVRVLDSPHADDGVGEANDET